MPRIRTIKPEFFRHEELQDLETANPGKYCMLVFVGLWTQCDNQGVFPGSPRQLKLDILPFLDFDMDKTLTTLEHAKFLIRYAVGEKLYGMIPSFPNHQRFTGKEAGESGQRYPTPDEGNLNSKNKSNEENHTEKYKNQTKTYNLLELKRESTGKQRGNHWEISKVQERDKEQGKGTGRENEHDNEEIVISPPTEEEVIQFFVSNGYSQEAGCKAWAYYDAGGWRDSNGKPVMAWKQKMIAVWFKDDSLPMLSQNGQPKRSKREQANIEACMEFINE